MSYGQNRLHAIMLAGALMLQTACHHGSDNQAPTAVFTASQPSSDQVTTYAFSSAGTTDKDGTVTTFTWDFGDGTSSAAPSPVHVYGATGYYAVKLTVADNNGATASTTGTVDIKTPAVSAAVETAAVTVSLPQVVSVQVPEAAFPSRTHLGIWTTSNPATAADFDLTAQMFGASLRAAEEIRINTGKVKLSKTIKVIANLPAELDVRLKEKDEPKVFVQIFQAGGEEVLDSFELIPASYDAARKTLQFDLSMKPGKLSSLSGRRPANLQHPRRPSRRRVHCKTPSRRKSPVRGHPSPLPDKPMFQRRTIWCYWRPQLRHLSAKDLPCNHRLLL